MRNLSKHSFVVMCLAVFIAVVVAPALYATASQPPGYQFAGFAFNAIDGNSYLAKMRQGWEGNWAFSLPFTAEPGEGAYLFLFYLFLGHVARILGLSLIVTFHLARVIAALTLFLVVWRLVTAIFPKPRDQRSAMIWLTFSGGMGWIPFVLGELPVDFFVAEMYVLLSSWATVHFPLGLALQMWLLMPSNEERQSWADRLKMVGAALLLAVISPFGIPIVLVAWGGVFMWEYAQKQDMSQTWQRLIWVGLGGGPVLVYYFLVSRSHPVLSLWNAQNITPSPPWWDVLLGLFPAIIFAAIGVKKFFVSKGKLGKVLVSWAALSLVLVYIPFSLQRRFLMGLSIPIVIVAVYGLSLWLEKHTHKMKFVFVGLFVLLAPTVALNLLVVQFGVQTAEPKWYLSMDEVDMYAWMDQNLPEDALVLASNSSSMFLPGRAGLRVMIGHPYETANFAEMEELVDDYFSGSFGVNESDNFLADFNVAYVLYGPRESKLSEGSWSPSGLELIQKIGEVSLYKVP